MTALRPLLALFLSLSLVWASVLQAQAHGGMSGGMQVTLCDSSGQEVTVSLDRNGNPVAPHDCTDCLAATSQAVLPAPTPVPAISGTAQSADASILPFPPPASTGPHRAQPRAPPNLLV